MFSLSAPAGKYWGISVRIHFTFFFFVWYFAQQYDDWRWGLALVGGLYLCILLHEFGHSLATRFCGGEANEILIWPLGGLAFCRPVHHPTAHLATTVAGPLVTLLLWVLLSGVVWILDRWEWNQSSKTLFIGYEYCKRLGNWNLVLLLFNLIPAFPMDGGRILLELLWYRMPFERAANLSILVSRVIALVGGVYAYFYLGSTWLTILAVLVFFEAPQQAYAMMEGPVVRSFSLRECFRQWKRRSIFSRSISTVRQAAASESFHCCSVCKRTEIDSPELSFRVASDGNEYCIDHLKAKSVEID